MVRSTAHFISYDLRPAKQSERRIILDLLKIAGDSGLPITTYRYVGMGANRFYDFLLMHKYLGIKKMVSLEHETNMFKRAVFNCPYKFIDVRQVTALEFINSIQLYEPSILWFDYDGGIKPGIINDIAALSTKLKVNDFCFVTVNGGRPNALRNENASARLEWFKDQLGDVAVDVTIKDVENSTFSDAVHKVLIAAFTKAFSFCEGGKFVPFFQVEYADSMRMITIGGGLLSDETASAFGEKVAKAMPFLSAKNKSLYEIKSLHLTDRERVLFDRAATAPDRRSSEYYQIKNLGFDAEEYASYKDLIRYLPRYVETIV